MADEQNEISQPQEEHEPPFNYQRERFTKIIALQRNNDIIAMLLDGKETKEIVRYLMNKYEVSKASSHVYIYECRKKIKEREKYEVHNLINLHIARYEWLYAQLTEMGDHNYAMHALKAKEKLLGFHKEGFHMKVTQGEIHSVQQTFVDSEYDLKKLEIEKRYRFDRLMLRAAGYSVTEQKAMKKEQHKLKKEKQNENKQKNKTKGN